MKNILDQDNIPLEEVMRMVSCAIKMNLSPIETAQLFKDSGWPNAVKVAKSLAPELFEKES